jgi:hypothetical protein
MTAPITTVCDAIAAMPTFGAVDAKNIVLAMQLRVARMPLTEPNRNALTQLLRATEAGLVGIWIEGGAR